MNTLDAFVGYGKQVAKGTPLANPTFVHGISGGPILVTEVENEVSPATSGKRIATSARRKSVANGAQFDSPGYKASLPFLIYAAMGAIATVGAEAPYTHTIKPGDLFYSTFFRKFAGVVSKVQDVKINELKLAFDGPGSVEVSVEGPGTLWTPNATFVGGTDETGSDSEWTFIGGSTKIDVVGAVPAEADVIKGELTISNSAEGEPKATSVQNAIVSEGVLEAEVSMTIVPSDLTMWNAALTGADAGNGNAVDEDIVYGSFEWTLTNGADTIVVSGDRVPFVIEHPEGGGEGGRPELEAVGLILGAVGSDAFTFVVTNTVASY